MTEDQHHMALVQWVRFHPWWNCFIHIPNEQKAGPQFLGKLKKMGLIKGVPDFFLAIPARGFPGMWLEIKATKKKPTKDQMAFLNCMNDQGYLCKWSDDLDYSINTISYYLDL